jgi:N-acetylneuraminate synthase
MYINDVATEFSIGNRQVGKDHPPLVVVEIGINHEGNLSVAKEMVDAALMSGAEVIKHQTHIPDKEMSVEARHVIPGNSNKSIYEIISRCALSLEDESELANYVRSKGLIYLSTPFSREAVDFLMSINVPAFKIGSGECNNYPFVEYVASQGKPVILSTGMNSVQSITPSVEILEKHRVPYALLHCTNLYPTPEKLIRLNSIQELSKFFPNAILGLSDHSITNFPCFGAVALGASILERHFTDSKKRPGPDIACSMDPIDLSELIIGSKTIHASLQGSKLPLKEEEVTAAFAFASVVAAKELVEGEILTKDSIALRRPGNGDFGPKDFYALIGKRVTKQVLDNHQISKSDIA